MIRVSRPFRHSCVLQDWKCPVCRGFCNCSICRNRQGKCATGILIGLARQNGHSNVKDYLAQYVLRRYPPCISSSLFLNSDHQVRPQLVRSPCGQWCCDVIVLSQPFYDFFDEDVLAKWPIWVTNTTANNNCSWSVCSELKELAHTMKKNSDDDKLLSRQNSSCAQLTFSFL